MKQGLIHHILAKGAYVASALLLHAFLSRYFEIADYGLLSLIITIISFNYLFVNNGVRQALAIALARDEQSRGALIKMALTVQVLLAVFLTLLNVFASATLGSILDDERLPSLLSLAAFIIPFAAVYFGFLGVLNGLKFFKEESQVMIIYAIMRLLPLPFLLLLPLNSSLKTVIWAFLIGSLTTVVYGFLKVKMLIQQERDNKDAEPVAFLSKSTRLCLFYMGTTILMSTGVISIKVLLADDRAVGLFSAALTLSRPIYFFSVALTAVAIPGVATSLHNGDTGEARLEFLFGFRLLIVVVAPLLITLGGMGPKLLSTLFPAKYIAAAPTFAILLAGLFFLSLMMYANSIIHAIDEHHPIRVELLVVPLSFLLHYLLLPIYGINGAALALLLASIVGALYTVFEALQKLGIKPKGKDVLCAFALNLIVLCSVLVWRIVFVNQGLFSLFVMAALQISIHMLTAKNLQILDFRELWQNQICPKFEVLKAESV